MVSLFPQTRTQAPNPKHRNARSKFTCKYSTHFSGICQYGHTLICLKDLAFILAIWAIWAISWTSWSPLIDHPNWSEMLLNLIGKILLRRIFSSQGETSRKFTDQIHFYLLEKKNKMFRVAKKALSLCRPKYLFVVYVVIFGCYWRHRHQTLSARIDFSIKFPSLFMCCVLGLDFVVFYVFFFAYFSSVFLFFFSRKKH